MWLKGMNRIQYNRIKEVLEENNKDVYWLQSQLESVTIPIVTRWCKNVKQPTIEQLFEIAQILEIDVRELLVPSPSKATEILEKFQGKNNVRHIVSASGNMSWLTPEISFADETYAKGACKLNTVENETKHVLFLFNSDNEEVGRYYLGKKLQGMSPAQLVEIKESLVFFESWNPESESWVPCVGVGLQPQFARPNVPTKKEQRSPIAPADGKPNYKPVNPISNQLPNVVEEKRFVTIADVKRGKLTEEELLGLFAILDSYSPVEYTERNIWTINHYTKFPFAYSECLDHNCFPEDFERAWLKFRYTNLKALETKLFFWGAVYCGEWKYYVSKEIPEYNRENLKKLFLAAQKRRIVHHKVIDGETEIMSALSCGEGDKFGF
jgi:hypothetical protein